jgi:energy-coupling factor transporter ATP-binding protein EcfA2
VKLKKARVTNFRSVEDSGEFTLDDITCLVGKNEAGKTAILLALSGLDPEPSLMVNYNIERDYPRRHLNDYKQRHPDEHAVVAATTWELEEEEIFEVEAMLCPGALKSRLVTAQRRYESPDAEWEADINYQLVVDHFITEARLSAPERAQLGKPANSQQLRAAVKAIEAPTEKHQSLIGRLDKLKGGSIVTAVRDLLSKRCPYFMYFSHYDRMVGEIRLDTLQARIDGAKEPPVESGELVFLDFLHFAGTSLKEIDEAQTYEALNARCEAASIKITDQLLEYWRQNPNLSIDVRVTKAEPNDPAPFDEGVIARARVRNDLYRMSVPFSERSAGFIWFFSFLVKFSEVKRRGEPILLVLDEPGLTLHGTAQSDLLRYFDEKLGPDHQVIFSTHSPFMVPPNRFETVRVVEDRLFQKRPGVWDSEGTKVRDDALTVDRDTLFPLQGALGYELTQTLFVGKHTALLEGTSDIVYLQVLSDALRRRGRTILDPRWTLSPAGGIDKIQSFVSLFGGRDLHVAVLTDFAKGDAKKIENLKARQVLEDGHLITFATALDLDEADVEDIFDARIYAEMLNGAYGLTKKDRMTGDRLLEATDATNRLVKHAEAAMRLVKADIAEFDHFAPAGWLIRNQTILDGDGEGVPETLDRAEKVIQALNALMKE